jgi:uncharacterized protein
VGKQNILIILLKRKIVEIILKQQDNRGYAMARDAGQQAGLMTYTVASPELIIIDHTEVKPAYGGKDVGKQLFYKITNMAREKGVKIIPLCPFATAMFKRFDDVHDLLKS